MTYVKDPQVKKLLIAEFNEELERLKEGKNTGRYTPDEFKVRKKHISDKKAQVRAGKYHFR